MSPTFEVLARGADHVASKLGRARIGVVLGSGLSEALDNLERPQFLPYGEVPGMAAPTTVGHRGALVRGSVDAERQPRDDREAGVAQLRREAARVVQALAGGVAAAGAFAASGLGAGALAAGLAAAGLAAAALHNAPVRVLGERGS